MDFNAAQCPLCKQPNQCAMEQARLSGQALTHPCWCTSARFSAELLASVPAAAQRLSCICAACAAGRNSPTPVMAPHV